LDLIAADDYSARQVVRHLREIAQGGFTGTDALSIVVKAEAMLVIRPMVSTVANHQSIIVAAGLPPHFRRALNGNLKTNLVAQLNAASRHFTDLNTLSSPALGGASGRRDLLEQPRASLV